MSRLFLLLFVCLTPTALAQTLADFLEFGETEVAYQGSAPSLGFSGYVEDEPFALGGSSYIGGVSVVDASINEFEIDVSLLDRNGLEFDPLPRLQAPDDTRIIDDNLSVTFIGQNLLANDYEGCFGIEGSTGEFSSDVYVLRANVGARLPALSSANQFRCEYVRRTDPTPTEDARVYYLRAGVLRNELTVTTLTYADPGINFGLPVQIDEGIGQITGFDQDFLRFPFRGPVMPATLIVWDSFGSNGNDNSLLSVQGRMLDIDGIPVGSQFQVNTFISNNQFSARVSGNGQQFVVVWTSQGSPGNDDSLTSIQGRLFSADGTAIGDQFQVNQSTAGDQFEPDVVMLEDGSFYVVWTDQPMVSTFINGRPFAADGSPAGNEIQLSDSPGADMPKLESNGRDVLVLWRRTSGIESRFSISRIFRDGFEAIPL